MAARPRRRRHHLIDAVLDQDAAHLVSFPDEGAEPLVTGRAGLRASGADALGAALLTEGEPGSACPAAFKRGRAHRG